jgi:bifunctional non-homologous end joining protein LigD
MPSLPDFIPPMLAKSGAPFDSDEHLFEVKWDGTRALAFIECGHAYRLRNRKDRDQAMRYPELAFLGELEEGLVLDGEIVMLDSSGRPDFSLMLKREQARDPKRAAALARAHPATYVVFDLLYRGFEPRMDLALEARRAELAQVVEACSDVRLVLSDGVVGAGKAFFEQVTGLGIEGVVAKRLGGGYQSGQRTGDWCKIKPVHRLHCAILGYSAEDNDLRSLVIAADEGGRLRCVGRVGSGLRESMRGELLERLRARPRATPLIECDLDGSWVEPGLYCTVSFLEKTKSGTLRAPVFVKWVEEAS